MHETPGIESEFGKSEQVSLGFFSILRKRDESYTFSLRDSSPKSRTVSYVLGIGEEWEHSVAFLCSPKFSQNP